ncbi:MAG: peptidase M48 [Candidatus Melainabacteria bacterium RIFCSPHIGHO2_02_FULL_34_12]|nr:MAG: peptidase M48 [Candidatus Melainabacteria bacterium RIFCSPHIGHO2_02_FULL_34_12]
MKKFVCRKEEIYFGICLLISLLFYFICVVSIAGIGIILFLAFISLISQGIFIGNLRGNGIRVSEKQFPKVHKMAEELYGQLELKEAPAIFILQAGGWLNAFATKFLKGNFVVIFSDILELAYEKGDDALTFVLCHELAHIKRNHTIWHILLFPSFLIPFLGKAYSRACEYTCDNIAAHFQPKGAVPGLLVLAAGKKLYKEVDLINFRKQLDIDGGFWYWFSEILSTHPHLSSRLSNVGLQGNVLFSDYTTIEKPVSV